MPIVDPFETAGVRIVDPFAAAPSAPAAQPAAAPARSPDEDVPLRDDPNKTYGTVLPFAKDNATGSLEWAVPEMIRAPVRGIVKGGQEALGLRPFNDPSAREDITSAASLGAGGLVGAARGKIGEVFPKPSPEAVAAAKANRDAALETLKQAQMAPKAAKALERRLNEGSGVSAQEIVDRLKAGRALGKPLTLADVGGPGVQGLVGKVGRMPGESQNIVRRALDERDKAALGRLSNDMRELLTQNTSAYRTARDLIRARDEAAKPLYEKAMKGEAVVPVEEQFRPALEKADADIAGATEAATRAGIALTKAEVASSVPAMRAARAAVDAAAEVQSAAAARKYDLLEKQEAARAAPAGTITSPRVQQFLDDPIVKKGIERGLETQRLEALAKGENFDPAMAGVDASGNITTPNMRTLDAVKKGLDAIMESEGRDEYGRLNSRGRDVNAVRVAFLNEVDRINPEYAAARQSWAGHSASLDAMKFGKSVMRGGEHQLSVEEIADTVAKMSESDREFARVGLAEAILDKVKDMGFSGDEAKAVAKSVLRQEKMRPLFRSTEDADKFILAVDEERAMFETKSRLTGGSPTAERVAEDMADKVSGAAHAAHGVSHMLRGNPFSAAGSWMRSARDLGLRNNEGLNAAIARMGVDEHLMPTVDPLGRLVLPSPEIPAPKMVPP